MNLIFTFALVIFLYVAQNFNCVLCQTDKNSHLNNEFETKGDLLFVQLIFRHGDRTPLKFYPNDPWKDEKFWNDEPGQLTNMGKRQQFELGLYMRKRYSAFLNDTYSDNDIYVQSSDLDRTIMSAKSFLAGMYNTKAPTDIWNTHLPWQPIPVHITPSDFDYLISGNRQCDAYDERIVDLKASDTVKLFDQKHKELYDYLSLQSGDTVQTMSDVISIRDTIMIEEVNNRTLPEWTKKIYPGGDLYDSIEEAALKTFVLDTSTPFLAKIKAGFLLKDILDRFSNKSTSTLDPDRKFWVYSGHDTTICRMLNTLGLLESLPPYSTSILFEMRNVDDVPHIEIFFKNSTSAAVPLHIPNCGLSCPLEDLYVLYKDVLPSKSFDDECIVQENKRSSADENASNLILKVVALSVLLIHVVYSNAQFSVS